MDTPPLRGSTCASCNAGLQGAFCASCGQRVLRERHTLRSFLRSGASQLLDLDRGFLHTATRLVVEPGTVVRRYLDGGTVRYTHPVAYVAVAFAAFALTGGMTAGTAGLADGSNRLFTATIIPVVALASYVVFGRARLNYAEHLIITSYLLGTVLLALSLLQALTPIVPLSVVRATGLAGLAASVGYFCWSYSRIFARRPALAAAGALLTLAAGVGMWVLALLFLLPLLRSNG